MATDANGRSLFIVDNSISGWTGLRYLEEWAGISRAFDIATGFFEVGSFLALDGKWQGLDKIRVLITKGAEANARTRRTLVDGVRKRAVEMLDQSIESDKQGNPFLKGVPAILDALRRGRGRIFERRSALMLLPTHRLRYEVRRDRTRVGRLRQRGFDLDRWLTDPPESRTERHAGEYKARHGWYAQACRLVAEHTSRRCPANAG